MVAVLIFVLGLAIGSFLNVCIYRIPREGLSINVPQRSFCPQCQTPIRVYDNIPVVSFLLLRGHCRACNSKISISYPIVELVTGGLYLVMLYRFGISLELLHGCLFVTLLVPVAWIDARWYIIPNAIIYLGGIAGLAITSSISLIRQDVNFFIEHLVGAIAGCAATALIGVLGGIIFRKQAMGMGDVKLMGLIGMFLGAWPHLLLVIMSSALIGSVVGVTLIICGAKDGPHSRIPYGPFLAFGAVLDLLWGRTIWVWYLKLIGW
ncbi:MAG: prepilin peptidase [Candidatus Poribacteria bacterium]|nr:prepilin peptidase [Candidatus Poribacteria bacterium]